MCLDTTPLNRIEAKGDFVMIETRKYSSAYEM